MTPADFRLADVLECCAAAIEEREEGRLPASEAAWLEAHLAASGLFPAGSPASAAISAVIAACDPASGTVAPAGLYLALDAASLAAVSAARDVHGMLRTSLPHAVAATDGLPPQLAGAMTVLLGEASRMADAGSEAIA